MLIVLIYTARDLHMVLVVFNQIFVAHLKFLGCMQSKIGFIFNFVMTNTFHHAIYEIAAF